MMSDQFSELRLQRYVLERRLGAGAMGTVWLAENVATREKVALKIMKSHLFEDSNFVKRFEREVSAANSIDSPYVLPASLYVEGSLLCIEMPYVPGRSLSDELSVAPSGFSIARALRIFQQLASAASAAHDASINHRDIKPANILVSKGRDGLDHVYLIDFGIAKAADDTDLTASGSVVGTLRYMAPERILGSGDHRSDLYALACVLYEMLTGRPPFVNPDGAALMYAHLNSPATAPSIYNPLVPPYLNQAVLKALAKDPADRFQSAAALAAAVRSRPNEVESTHLPIDLVRSTVRQLVPPPTALSPQSDLVDVVFPTQRTNGTVVEREQPETGQARSSSVQERVNGHFSRALQVIAVAVVVALTAVVWSNSSGGSIEDAIEPRVVVSRAGTVWSLEAGSVGGRSAVIAGARDNPNVQVWFADTAEPPYAPLNAESSTYLDVAESEGRSVIAVGSESGEVEVWDLDTGDLISNFSMGSDIESPTSAVSAAYFQGSLTVAVGYEDGRVAVWSESEGRLAGPLDAHANGAVRAIELAGAGERIFAVSGSFDGSVRVLDANAGEFIGLPIDHGSSITSIALGADENLEGAVGDANGIVQRWDFLSQSRIGSPINASISSVPDVRIVESDGVRLLIAAGGELSTIGVFDFSTGEEVGPGLTRHEDSVNALAVSGDSLFSGDGGGTILQWDLRSIFSQADG